MRQKQTNNTTETNKKYRRGQPTFLKELTSFLKGLFKERVVTSFVTTMRKIPDINRANKLFVSEKQAKTSRNTLHKTIWRTNKRKNKQKTDQ